MYASSLAIAISIGAFSVEYLENRFMLFIM